MIVLRDIVNIGVTSATALGAGLLFETAGVPAPYLMGSLFGVWVLGGISARCSHIWVLPDGFTFLW